jgi:two-component system chemotaxis response regulator CheY
MTIKTKILVVEDDEDIREMVHEIVQKKGFDVVTADDGEKAIAVFKKEKPNLVLADIRMPGMDGIQMAEALKKLDSSIPIILFSGLMPNLIEDKLENRITCDHVLYKPFAQSDILESINLFLTPQGKQ